MSTHLTDELSCRLDEQSQSLHLNLRGADRPSIIARVTQLLDQEALYISSMTFHLMIAQHEFAGSGVVPYVLDAVARGGAAALRQAHERIQEGVLKQLAPDQGTPQAPPVSLQSPFLFHLALYTPDRPGLTAMLAEVVGRVREHQGEPVNGSFVHLMAITFNDGGAQGGTPYFSLRANVATKSRDIQETLMDDLLSTARENGFENDLWTRCLNHPATP